MRKRFFCVILTCLMLVNMYFGMPTIRVSASDAAPIPNNAAAKIIGNKVDISWEGDALATDLSNGYLVEVARDGGSFDTVVNYTYATSNVTVSNFVYSFFPSISGSYTFKITGVAGNNKSPSILTTSIDYPGFTRSVFGSSTDLENNLIEPKDDKSIILTSQKDKGKISSSVDGINFYYTELDASKAFQLSAKVKVLSFAANNQVSFGLMLRNTIGIDGRPEGHASNFVAVGGYNQKMQAFSRGLSGITTQNITTVIPSAEDVYTLTLIKTTDNKCIVTCGSYSTIIDTTGLFTGNTFFLGLFTARNTSVTFSDIKVVTGIKEVTLVTPPTKLEYWSGESLDFTGMNIEATFEDGTKRVLSSNECYVSGFDTSKVGMQTVSISYGGKHATFDVNVKPLFLTGLSVIYTPAKTTYYIGDSFELSGTVIAAVYNSGVKRELNPSEYTLTGFDSTTPGEKTINVTLNANKDMTSSFKVNVKSSVLQGLEIVRQPSKTLYYLNETLKLNGLTLKAIYDDSSQILSVSEYVYSGFDSSTIGKKNLVISHKGKTIELPYEVKAKEVKGIEVTTLPKTTYYKGEKFSASGMVVSTVYDNNEKIPLASSDYTVDDSSFNSSTPGTYNITITPNDKQLKQITFPVTVRDNTNYIWKAIEFGQSTSPVNNTISPEKPGEITGKITLKAGSNDPFAQGGKVTGAHDGISFYYTEIDANKDNFVLSADIKVIEFAKPSPDNQEAFGLMVRDAIGINGDSSVFSSNVAAIGGYRGTTQAFMRTGVVSSLGNEGTVQTATNWSTEKPAPSNTYPIKNYRLTLSKTNTGFVANLNGSSLNYVLFYAPDDFNSQDSKLYVGFYAARIATIEVSNVSFSVSDAQTDSPKVLPPPTTVTPNLKAVSLPASASTNYDLKLTSNIAGTVTVKQGENVIASDLEVEANEITTINTNIALNSNTTFTITLIPDSTYEKVITHFTVTMKNYNNPDNAIFVSPNGQSLAKGTKDDPVDVDTAISFLKEGQAIYLLGGTYLRNKSVTIPSGNNGSAAQRKRLVAYNGEKVIFDFNKSSGGFILSGDYWDLYGIGFTKSTGSGLTIGGNHNIVELCSTYANANSGLTISRTSSVGRELWPSYNLILNCESYDNQDSSENNADGFAAKLTCGEGNVFRGCIARNNIDDGWDLYTKAETGPIGAVVIENCIAYNNGTLSSGYLGKGDKNGFKLGGEGIAVPNIIRDSIAFNNGAAGFTSNSNPVVQAYNCVSYDNNGANINFSSYANIPTSFVIDNFVSYRSVLGVGDIYPASTVSTNNYFYNKLESVNKLGVVLKNSNFASLTPKLPYERDINGNLIKGDFLKFIPPSTGNGSSTGGGSVSPDKPDVTVKDNTITVNPNFNSSTGEVKNKVDEKTIESVFSKIEKDSKGNKLAIIDIPKVDGANAYTLTLPASVLSKNSGEEKIEIITDIGKITLSSNMYIGMNASNEISLTIKVADIKNFKEDVKAKIGSRPAVEISISIDDKKVEYFNPDVPVEVMIPYNIRNRNSFTT